MVLITSLDVIIFDVFKYIRHPFTSSVYMLLKHIRSMLVALSLHALSKFPICKNAQYSYYSFT
jgi:hypothetical protein